MLEGERPFSRHTNLLGWVKNPSALYEEGIRPGDEITEYGGRPFTSFQDFLVSRYLDHGPQVLIGEKINYETGEKTPFQYVAKAEDHGDGKQRAASMLSVAGPAGYLIYKQDHLMKSSPMEKSGILSGDRIIWVDGELIFSRKELGQLINQPRALLTVEREGETFLTRVPRLQVRDLRLSALEQAEIQDWAYASKLEGGVGELFFIPYTLSSGGVVESAKPYIDEEATEVQRFNSTGSSMEKPLEPGDKILAVDGKEVEGSSAFLQLIQNREVQIIVQRGENYPTLAMEGADEKFLEGVSFADLATLTNSIGKADRRKNIGSLYMLSPVIPKPLNAFSFSDTMQKRIDDSVEKRRKEIENIENPKKRALAMQQFEGEQSRLLLGGVFEDRKVWFNPNPLEQFKGVFNEIWRTFSALFTGYLSPKNLSGPVGIVQVMQTGWGLGIKEALYWMGLISVNLGILNLLPIPVLDGGHICFALYEMITGRRIKAKVMERLIIPFVILLIGFFIYATYHDLGRIFSF